MAEVASGCHDCDHEHEADQVFGKWFVIKNILLLLPYLYLIVIEIVRPTGGWEYTWHYGIWIPLTSYIVFWEGRFYFRIYPRILRGKLDMNTLIGLAAHIIFVYSVVIAALHLTAPMYSYDQFWEAPALLVVITRIGQLLESRLRDSSLVAFKKLNAIQHNLAQVLKDDGTTVDIPAKDVQPGDTILVRPGEGVPLDGQILNPSGSFNYANITGEASPVSVQAGEAVLSGAYCLGDAVQLRVTRTFANSTLAQIIDRIEHAAENKPRLQLLADKMLRWFVPSILGIAFLTFIVWLIVGYSTSLTLPWAAVNEGNTWNNALKAGVSTLAIACPCVLGVATPLVNTLTSIIAMQSGLLINDYRVMESLPRIKYFAFDKTGTLTTGKMVVRQVHGKKTPHLGVIKAIEANFNHPVAAALRALPGAVSTDVTNIKRTHHDQITALWNKQPVVLGRYDPPATDKTTYDPTSTLVSLRTRDQVLLVVELASEIKTEARMTVRNLVKQGLVPVMITGDAPKVAQHIAKQVGIDKVYAEVSPAEKGTIVAELQKSGPVAFVGDGFNDGVAMKQADVGIAFATGSDITNSLADISILSKYFDTLERIVQLARMNRSRIIMSLLWAVLFNLIAVPLAMILLVPPWISATVMTSADVLLIATAWQYKHHADRRFPHREHTAACPPSHHFHK